MKPLGHRNLKDSHEIRGQVNGKKKEAESVGSGQDRWLQAYVIKILYAHIYENIRMRTNYDV